MNSVVFRDFCYEDSNNCIYSIDMIRLSCKISVDYFSKKIDSRLSILNNIEKWQSSKIGEFKHNYKIVDNDNSFWLGFISNSELYCGEGGVGNPKKKYNLTIEFNPNKLRDMKLLTYLLSLSFEDNLQCPIMWHLVSCDFAFDIETNILNICGFDKGRKRALKIYDNGGDNKTYYIGENNNRLKIYNKRIESNLDYELTRIELTHKVDIDVLDLIRHKIDLNLSKYFPDLFLKDYQVEFKDFEIDSTLQALVYAVNNGFPLHDLSRRYRDKVKDFLNEKKPIVFDYNGFALALSRVLCFYFPYYL